ncbi:MAG: L,D-transpeptidase family protein [Steroidobacteraceae bacterium]
MNGKLHQLARHGASIAAVAALTLSGCSLITAPWHKQEAAKAPAAAAPEAAPVVEEPALAAPLATHRFDLHDTDDDVVGTVQVAITSKEDTLPDIARRFDIGYEEIVRANPGVDPWLPGAGRKIVVPTQFVLPNAPHEGLVINVAAMRLYYYPKPAKGETQQVFTYPIGIGKVGWSTPEGVTKVVTREKNPTWRPGPGVRKEHQDDNDPLPAVIPPGPDNPLGKYKFTLGWPEYLIHGTNKPYGVGLRSSHGCIRLYPEDIEKLFNAVPLGTQVRVVNQPFVFGWHHGQAYLQAYTVLEDDPRNWQSAQRTLLSKSLSPRLSKELKDSSSQINWSSVSQVTHTPLGLVVAVSGDAGTTESVIATARLVENRIPAGSNWDGSDEQDSDQQSYKQLLSEREPSATPKPATAAAPKPAGST